MSIDVEWRDERGETLERYEGPPIDFRLPERSSESSRCLRFIDPYGDTTFNAAQVAVSEEELTSIASDREVGEQANSLLTFVKRHSDRLHKYLKFIGD